MLLLNRGQASTEFLVVIIFLMLIFISVFAVYSKNRSELVHSSLYLDAKTECYLISNMINRVMAGGKDLVETGSFHNAKVFGDMRGVEVYFEKGYVYCKFSTSNVTNLTHRTFDLSGDYRVFNDGENVVFKKQ